MLCLRNNWTQSWDLFWVLIFLIQWMCIYVYRFEWIEISITFLLWLRLKLSKWLDRSQLFPAFFGEPKLGKLGKWKTYGKLLFCFTWLETKLDFTFHLKFSVSAVLFYFFNVDSGNWYTALMSNYLEFLFRYKQFLEEGKLLEVILVVHLMLQNILYLSHVNASCFSTISLDVFSSGLMGNFSHWFIKGFFFFSFWGTSQWLNFLIRHQNKASEHIRSLWQVPRGP